MNDFIKHNVYITQNYYPEVLGQAIIINIAFILQAAWVVVKAFLDDNTKKKVITKGSDSQKTLLEFIDEENLPSFLGGSCQCQPNGCVAENRGPWNN